MYPTNPTKAPSFVKTYLAHIFITVFFEKHIHLHTLDKRDTEI